MFFLKKYFFYNIFIFSFIMKEQKLNDSILKLKDEDKLEDDLFYLNKRTIKKIKKLKKIKK